MKLKEAIEILTLWQKGGDITSFDDVNTAVALLIKAGKAISDYRQGLVVDFLLPLPGEAEE